MDRFRMTNENNDDEGERTRKLEQEEVEQARLVQQRRSYLPPTKRSSRSRVEWNIPQVTIWRIAANSLVILMVVLLIFVAGYFMYEWFRIGPQPSVTSPASIPTAIPTPTERVVNDPWKDIQWLSPDEARTLRTKDNVVNLALLQDGGALYSAQYTINFTENSFWQKVTARPFGMENYDVQGTTVQFALNRFTYNLNLLQPFVDESDLDTIYVFDPNGELWTSQANQVTLVRLDQVHLIIGIAPNTNLTFTTKKGR